MHSSHWHGVQCIDFFLHIFFSLECVWFFCEFRNWKCCILYDVILREQRLCNRFWLVNAHRIIKFAPINSPPPSNANYSQCYIFFVTIAFAQRNWRNNKMALKKINKQTNAMVINIYCYYNFNAIWLAVERTTFSAYNCSYMHTRNARGAISNWNEITKKLKAFHNWCSYDS